MHSIKLFGKPYALPSAWPELSQAQLLAIVPLVFAGQADAQRKLLVLRALLPVSVKLRHLRRLTDQERFDLVQLVNFLWTDPVDLPHIEKFEYADQTYYLPGKNLENAVAIEYAMADLLFRSFAREQKPEALDKLVATICRPAKPPVLLTTPDWDGDMREKYNSALADRRVVLFRELPVAIKVQVLQYFISCQRHIHSSYRIWEAPQAGQGGGPSRRITWIDIMMDISERGVFGDWDRVCFTPLHTILFYLQKKKTDAD